MKKARRERRHTIQQTPHGGSLSITPFPHSNALFLGAKIYLQKNVYLIVSISKFWFGYFITTQKKYIKIQIHSTKGLPVNWL